MLPISGVFDMNDCTVLIDCPIDGTADEVQRMTTVLESIIHVVDFKVTGSAAGESLEYLVNITEVPLEVAEGKKPKRSKF